MSNLKYLVLVPSVLASLGAFGCDTTLQNTPTNKNLNTTNRISSSTTKSPKPEINGIKGQVEKLKSFYNQENLDYLVNLTVLVQSKLKLEELAKTDSSLYVDVLTLMASTYQKMARGENQANFSRHLMRSRLLFEKADRVMSKNPTITRTAKELANFYYGLGQVCANLGDSDCSKAAYRKGLVKLLNHPNEGSKLKQALGNP